MPINSASRTIADLEVHTTTIPALNALNLGLKLFRVLGPAFAMIWTPNIRTGADLLKMDTKDFARMIVEFNESASDADKVNIVRQMLRSTAVTVNGKRMPLADDDAINAAFSGRPRALMGTLAFVFEHNNFLDFIKGARTSASNP